MNATRQLHDIHQSIWLDNITRGLLTSGALERYVSEFAVTGLTSNPTIFDRAIRNADSYDDAIRRKAADGKSAETLFFELALEDLSEAADLFRPVHDATAGVDGWVSLEVSPLLAGDTAGTVKAAIELHARARRPNLFIKIPGTRTGVPAIEEATFAGVPVNVTLLFSREQYIAAADAYWRGIERRIAADLHPNVDSVASLFVSRWDVAVQGKVPRALQNRLGIAIAMRTYKSYCQVLSSPRWQKLAAAGARPQRLLWASTGTKDPEASDVPLHRGARRTGHDQHHTREDAARICRSRRSERRLTGERRGCRDGARRICAGRRGRCEGRRLTPARRHRSIHALMARADELHRVEERSALESGAGMNSATSTTGSSAQTRVLTARPAWQGLEAHYCSITTARPTR
jgi:transaldolase